MLIEDAQVEIARIVSRVEKHSGSRINCIDLDWVVTVSGEARIVNVKVELESNKIA